MINIVVDFEMEEFMKLIYLYKDLKKYLNGS